MSSIPGAGMHAGGGLMPPPPQQQQRPQALHQQRGPHSQPLPRYRGVGPRHKGTHWGAQTRIQNKDLIWLGSFKEVEDAVTRYDCCILALKGPSGIINRHWTQYTRQQIDEAALYLLGRKADVQLYDWDIHPRAGPPNVAPPALPLIARPGQYFRTGAGLRAVSLPPPLQQPLPPPPLNPMTSQRYAEGPASPDTPGMADDEQAAAMAMCMMHHQPAPAPAPAAPASSGGQAKAPKQKGRGKQKRGAAGAAAAAAARAAGKHTAPVTETSPRHLPVAAVEEEPMEEAMEGATSSSQGFDVRRFMDPDGLARLLERAGKPADKPYSRSDNNAAGSSEAAAAAAAGGATCAAAEDAMEADDQGPDCDVAVTLDQQAARAEPAAAVKKAAKSGSAAPADGDQNSWAAAEAAACTSGTYTCAQQAAGGAGELLSPAMPTVIPCVGSGPLSQAQQQQHQRAGDQDVAVGRGVASAPAGRLSPSVPAIPSQQALAGMQHGSSQAPAGDAPQAEEEEEMEEEEPREDPREREGGWASPLSEGEAARRLAIRKLAAVAGGPQADAAPAQGPAVGISISPTVPSDPAVGGSGLLAGPLAGHAAAVAAHSSKAAHQGPAEGAPKVQAAPVLGRRGQQMRVAARAAAAVSAAAAGKAVDITDYGWLQWAAGAKGSRTKGKRVRRGLPSKWVVSELMAVGGGPPKAQRKPPMARPHAAVAATASSTAAGAAAFAAGMGEQLQPQDGLGGMLPLLRMAAAGRAAAEAALTGHPGKRRSAPTSPAAASPCTHLGGDMVDALATLGAAAAAVGSKRPHSGHHGEPAAPSARRPRLSSNNGLDVLLEAAGIVPEDEPMQAEEPGVGAAPAEAPQAMAGGVAAGGAPEPAAAGGDVADAAPAAAADAADSDLPLTGGADMGCPTAAAVNEMEPGSPPAASGGAVSPAAGGAGGAQLAAVRSSSMAGWSDAGVPAWAGGCMQLQQGVTPQAPRGSQTPVAPVAAAAAAAPVGSEKEQAQAAWVALMEEVAWAISEAGDYNRPPSPYTLQYPVAYCHPGYPMMPQGSAGCDGAAAGMPAAQEGGMQATAGLADLRSPASQQQLAGLPYLAQAYQQQYAQGLQLSRSATPDKPRWRDGMAVDVPTAHLALQVLQHLEAEEEPHMELSLVRCSAEPGRTVVLLGRMVQQGLLLRTGQGSREDPLLLHMHDCGFQLLGRFSEQAAATSKRLRAAMGIAAASPAPEQPPTQQQQQEVVAGQEVGQAPVAGQASSVADGQQGQQLQEEETPQDTHMAEGSAADVDMQDVVNPEDAAAETAMDAGAALATLQAGGVQEEQGSLASSAAATSIAVAPSQPAAATEQQQAPLGEAGVAELQQASLASPAAAATPVGGGSSAAAALKRKVPAAGAADSNAAFYAAWHQTCLQGYDPRNGLGQVVLCKLMTGLLSPTHPHTAATTAAAFTAAAAAAAAAADPSTAAAAANATAAAMQAALRTQMAWGGGLGAWGDQNPAIKKQRMSGKGVNTAGMDAGAACDGSSPSAGMSWLSSPAASGLTAPAAATGAGDGGVSSSSLECEVDGALSMELLPPHVGAPLVGDAAKAHQRAGAARPGSIQEQALLALLAHACTCTQAACPHNPSCQKLRGQLAHLGVCGQKVIGGCGLCGKLMRLLGLHARSCADAACLVPSCRQLKELQQAAGARNPLPHSQGAHAPMPQGAGCMDATPAAAAAAAALAAGGAAADAPFMRPPKPRPTPTTAAAKLPQQGLLHPSSERMLKLAADKARLEEWFHKSRGQQQDQQQQAASRMIHGLDLGGPSAVAQAPAVGGSTSSATPSLPQRQQQLGGLPVSAQTPGFMGTPSSLAGSPWYAAMAGLEGATPDTGADQAADRAAAARAMAAAGGRGGAMAAMLAAPVVQQTLAGYGQMLPASSGHSAAGAAQELLAAAAADQELDSSKCRMLQALAAKAAWERQAAKAAAAAAGARGGPQAAGSQQQDGLSLRRGSGQGRLALDLS